MIRLSQYVSDCTVHYYKIQIKGNKINCNTKQGCWWLEGVPIKGTRLHNFQVKIMCFSLGVNTHFITYSGAEFVKRKINKKVDYNTLSIEISHGKINPISSG